MQRPFFTAPLAGRHLWPVLLDHEERGVPRIAGILEDRKDRIAGDLGRSQPAERRNRRSDRGLRTGTCRSPQQGTRHRKHDTRAKLKADQEARREKAEAELAEKLKAAEAHIAGIKTEALSQIGDIAGDTTSALVEQLMGKAPTKTDLTKALKSAMN
jgi:F-type H+-transporting ATPase subunit b